MEAERSRAHQIALCAGKTTLSRRSTGLPLRNGPSRTRGTNSNASEDETGSLIMAL